MSMRVGERREVIFHGVNHGGMVQIALRRLTKRNFAMKTVHIGNGKNLNHG